MVVKRLSHLLRPGRSPQHSVGASLLVSTSTPDLLEGTGNTSMMSVVVKNPLRQGLHWAGDGRAATKNRGKVSLSAGEAVEGEQEERNGEEGNADALMSVLVRITVVAHTLSKRLRSTCTCICTQVSTHAHTGEATAAGSAGIGGAARAAGQATFVATVASPTAATAAARSITSICC